MENLYNAHVINTKDISAKKGIYFEKYMNGIDCIVFKNQDSLFLYHFKESRFIDTILVEKRTGQFSFLLNKETILTNTYSNIFLKITDENGNTTIDTFNFPIWNFNLPDSLTVEFRANPNIPPLLVNKKIYIVWGSNIDVNIKENLKYAYSVPRVLELDLKTKLFRKIKFEIPDNYLDNYYREWYPVFTVIGDSILFSPGYNEKVYLLRKSTGEGKFINHFASQSLASIVAYNEKKDSPKYRMLFSAFSTRYGKIDYLRTKNIYVRYAQSAKTDLDKISSFSFKNLNWYLVFADKDFNVLYEIKFDGAQYLNNYFFRNDELWVQKTFTNSDKKVEFAQIEIP
jgi:hypothetical protein